VGPVEDNLRARGKDAAYDLSLGCESLQTLKYEAWVKLKQMFGALRQDDGFLKAMQLCTVGAEGSVDGIKNPFTWIHSGLSRYESGQRLDPNAVNSGRGEGPNDVSKISQDEWERQADEGTE
jgi:hypothetical protein